MSLTAGLFPRPHEAPRRASFAGHDAAPALVVGTVLEMAKPILIWPDKVLQRPTAKVTDFGPALDTLLSEMTDSLREAEGIGIAANQIGVGLRLAWVGRPDGTFFEIINPELLETSEPVTFEEGCLS